MTFNGVGSTGYLFDYVNYGDGTTGTNLTNHTYTSNGNYTITAYEHNYSSTGLISSCSTQIQLVNPTYCGDGIVQTPNGSGTNEQCDDGNQDPYDGCDNICQPNTCMATYTPIIEPKFTVVASGWTGDTRIRLNFISTTVGSNLNYAWSIGQYSGSNGLT